MAIYKTQGFSIAIATAYGASKAISAITNANPGVATLAASHGIAVNDIFQAYSGWKRLNERVVRASVVATNDVTMEGIDTSSTTDYPVGEGIGTVREIATWTPVTQLLPEINASGGGFRKVDVTESDDVRVKELNTLAEAVNYEFKGHYDPALSWIPLITTISRSGLSTPYRLTLPGGAKIYGSGNIGFNPEPIGSGGVLVYSLSINTTADSTFYSS